MTTWSRFVDTYNCVWWNADWSVWMKLNVMTMKTDLIYDLPWLNCVNYLCSRTYSPQHSAEDKNILSRQQKTSEAVNRGCKAETIAQKYTRTTIQYGAKFCSMYDCTCVWKTKWKILSYERHRCDFYELRSLFHRGRRYTEQIHHWLIGCFIAHQHWKANSAKKRC